MRSYGYGSGLYGAGVYGGSAFTALPASAYRAVPWRRRVPIGLFTANRDGTDPRPLQSIAPVTGLQVEHRRPGGGWELTCRLALQARENPRAVAEGRAVWASVGGVRFFSGHIRECQRSDGWQVKASGLARQAETVAAAYGAGENIGNVPAAVNNAVMRNALAGWIPTDVGMVTSSQVRSGGTLAQVLNAYVAANGGTWQVDPRGNVLLQAEPTTPDLYVVAPINALGRTMDDFATALATSYLDEADASGNTVSVTFDGSWDTRVNNRFGVVELAVDATKYGLMNASEAASVSGGIKSLIGPRLAYTGSTVISPGMAFTPGGVPVHPVTITAGKRVRFIASQPGLTAGEVGRVLNVDVTLGQTTYNDETQTVSVSPVNSKPRDIGGVLSALASGEREKALDIAGFARPRRYFD